jgi:hypothetical protein
MALTSHKGGDALVQEDAQGTAYECGGGEEDLDVRQLTDLEHHGRALIIAQNVEFHGVFVT